MNEVFKGEEYFNADISTWDTGKVTNMEGSKYQSTQIIF
jgi:surface protein